MKRELLEKPFTPAQIRQRKGRNGMLDYVEGHTVIQRLNEALDGEWSPSRSCTTRCERRRCWWWASSRPGPS